ncbi:hypothetical protein FKM82_011611 [Ascaphus truei]
MKEKLDFMCTFGTVISGMDSHYDNEKEDRRWKYYCCMGNEFFEQDCQWSGDVNGFDANLRWEAPTDYYLVGTSSYYDNFNGERSWRYYYCAKS